MSRSRWHGVCGRGARYQFAADRRRVPLGGAGARIDDRRRVPLGGAGARIDDRQRVPLGGAGARPRDEQDFRCLRHAIVYVSVLGSERKRDATLRGLTAAHGVLQSAIAHELKLKWTPQLAFEYDPTVERGVRLTKLIDDLAPEPTPSEPAPPEPADPDDEHDADD